MLNPFADARWAFVIWNDWQVPDKQTDTGSSEVCCFRQVISLDTLRGPLHAITPPCVCVSVCVRVCMSMCVCAWRMCMCVCISRNRNKGFNEYPKVLFSSLPTPPRCTETWNETKKCEEFLEPDNGQHLHTRVHPRFIYGFYFSGIYSTEALLVLGASIMQTTLFFSDMQRQELRLSNSWAKILHAFSLLSFFFET